MNKPLAGIISLGCSKNLVDSEHILFSLKEGGFDITTDETVADVIVVNTCGFITPAKEESINVILKTAGKKKEGCILAVAGCLSQRYPSELRAELPEIDVLHGIGDYNGLIDKIRTAMGFPVRCSSYNVGRILATPPYRAYLRIADGCDNRCTYCAIPLIRGPKKSVPMDILTAEAEQLAATGVTELTLIAQDTSAYGTDIYGEPHLAELLEKLSSINGLKWIRVLYSYPNTIDEKLISTILAHDNIVNYIDMPIQHINPCLLVKMNRHGTAEHIRYITDYIRSVSDDFILRTTVMLGFPGETDKEFSQLAEFLQEHTFDRVGAFQYSAEDGTPAAEFDDQVEEAVAAERLDSIMRAQMKISAEFNKKRIGKTYDVLVEKIAFGKAEGRSYAEAPDVDGNILISEVPDSINVGDYIKVKIVSAGVYDLKGVYTDESSE